MRHFVHGRLNLACAALLAIAACSSDDDPDDDDATASSSSSSSSTSGGGATTTSSGGGATTTSSGGGATTTSSSSGQGGQGGQNCPKSNTKGDCNKLCNAVVAAKCSDGPPDVQTCAMFCKALNMADCPEWGGAMDCIGTSPTFTCDNNGSPVVAGCEAEFECIEPCIEAMGNNGQ